MTTQEINLNKYNLDYSAEFIPFSQSRNKEEKQKSLNWLVTIKRGNASLTTDYMQGCAHVKGYNQPPDGVLIRDTFRRNKLVDYTCETGMIATRWFEHNCAWGTFSKKQTQPIPKLQDVLWSLLMDLEVLDYSGFEDWADCFGYDTDSRKAEQTYQDCLKIALQFKQLFSDSEIAELREIFQDY